MEEAKSGDWKCFEFVCPLYPKCETAGGSCCALDDFFEDRTLSPDQCLNDPEKPFFREKKHFGRY